MNDAERLSALASRAYFEHYPDLRSDGGASYVREAYAPTRLRAELAEPTVHYCSIDDERAEPVGFIKLVAPSALELPPGSGRCAHGVSGDKATSVSLSSHPPLEQRDQRRDISLGRSPRSRYAARACSSS